MSRRVHLEDPARGDRAVTSVPEPAGGKIDADWIRLTLRPELERLELEIQDAANLVTLGTHFGGDLEEAMLDEILARLGAAARDLQQLVTTPASSSASSDRMVR